MSAEPLSPLPEGPTTKGLFGAGEDHPSVVAAAINYTGNHSGWISHLITLSVCDPLYDDSCNLQ